MPKGFNDCVKNGGRVVTKKLKGNKYLHICYDKEGKAHSGEVKTKKKETKKKKAAREKKQIENSKKLVNSLKELQRYFNDKRT
jgi:hypothetical protein